MKKLKMTIGGVEITVELFDTPIAGAIHQALPFSCTAVQATLSSSNRNQRITLTLSS